MIDVVSFRQLFLADLKPLLLPSAHHMSSSELLQLRLTVFLSSSRMKSSKTEFKALK